jgi:type II secretion system protein F
MPLYAYKAKKDDGSTVTGTLQAETERGAVDALGRQGIFPLEIREHGGMGAGPRVEAKRRRRITTDEIGLFTQQLGDLLKAGVPLNRALSTLSQQTSNQELADVVDKVRQDVSAGKSLHESLAKHPRLFAPLYVSMVKAGEAGGFLEDVLFRLALFIEKDQELKSRLKAALAYPALLIILGVAAIAFLMVFFIPRFSEIFKDMGGSLPGSTKIVMAVSYFVRDYWAALVAVAIVVVIALQKTGESAAGRRAMDRFKVALPLFGDIARKNAIARFTRTLGTLLKSGVPILSALGIAKEAMGNVVLQDDIEEASAGVKQGRGLADILRRSRQFPAMVVDMIAVGEESGNLDEVLVNVAESYDRQVDRAVKVFVTLFEPMLLVFMAAIIGFVVISMLLPVFTLSSTIGK